MVYILETTLINPKLVATYLSPSQSDISNNTTHMELIKNDNSLVKVIEVEDQSMRTRGTKVIDIAALETVTNKSCSEDNGRSNKDTFAAISSRTARCSTLNMPVGE